MSDHDIILLLSIVACAPFVGLWYRSVSEEDRKRIRENDARKAQAERERHRSAQEEWYRQQQEKLMD